MSESDERVQRVLRVREELGRVIVGQEALQDGLMIALLAGGHVLLEGVPGLAKSLAVASLAAAVAGEHRRVQFTPDLLPSDLLGTHVFRPQSGDWAVREGPIFCNVLLADEINRAPAKVQSALLEAMQERQVTLAGETRALPEPFLVLATQNPVEQEGTYPLPEAQVDRFLLKLVVGYPSRAEEKAILERMGGREPPRARAVASPADVLAAQASAAGVHVDPKIHDYVVELVFATREPASCGLAALAPLVMYGASPRASLALVRAARARALLDGRDYVKPHDVQRVAMDVLRHRVVTTYEAEAEGLSAEAVVARVLEHVRVP